MREHQPGTEEAMRAVEMFMKNGLIESISKGNRRVTRRSRALPRHVVAALAAALLLHIVPAQADPMTTSDSGASPWGEIRFGDTTCLPSGEGGWPSGDGFQA